MPELPEAETIVGQLRERVLGATILDYRLRREDIVRQGLATLSWYREARLVAAWRLGKSVVLEAAKEGESRFLVFELGMTGLLFFTLLNPSYSKHTHLTLFLTGSVTSLHYWNPRRFGRIHLLDKAGLERFAAQRFGKDPMTLSWEDFRALIGKRRGRLKPLLMHQQILAGIGNIYANEILFRARLHPYRIASRLRQNSVRRLYDAMRDVLQAAIAAGGSSVRDYLAPDGTKGTYKDRHEVYDKEGGPCPMRCGKTIRRLRGERSSFYCPACQRP